jgi:hypothetical protein
MAYARTDFPAPSLIDRLAMKRRALQLPSLRGIRQRAAASRRLRFEQPPLQCAMARALVQTVRSGRAFVASTAMLQHADTLLNRLIDAGPSALGMCDSQPILQPDDVFTIAPELYRIGLDDGMLDIAENYLREPCYYLGCSLKLERLSAPVAGTRLWHTDVEDDGMLRLIVYLNPVDQAGGPFACLDAAQSDLARRTLGYRSGFVTEAQMRTAVPESAWTRVTGPAGTLIAFDGARMFHRASPPTEADRFSITFTFVSRYPKQIWRASRLHRDSQRALKTILTKRQAQSIVPARWM